LCEILKAQGLVTLHANIALPNEGSVRLHESFGFQKVGECQNLGYKLRGWHSVGWWQKYINPLILDPSDPKPYGQLDPQVIRDIINSGVKKIR